MVSVLPRRHGKQRFPLAIFAAIFGISSALIVPAQATSAEPVGNTHIAEYQQANWNSQVARGVPYPSRTPPMVLRGSWYDMGKQYGQTKAEYIRIVYDAYYNLWLTSKLDPKKLGTVLDWYAAETKKFTPEMVEFARGIGDGAAPKLNDADNADALTNTQKIVFLNCLFEVVIPPAWPHLAQLMNLPAPPSTATGFEPFASHAWAVWGDMAPHRGGIMGGTRDQPWMPTLYNASYVAIPTDRKAAVTWGNTISGAVGASAQVNEHGVGLGNTIVSHKQQHFGVPALFATAHISFFARSAREATDMLTVGTPAYREKTGRSTLATTVGFFQIFADAKQGFTVERTGRHYAVRTAGTQQERGDYTVLANHAVAGNSNDEFGNATGQPMENWTVAAGPTSSSQYRYWALFHEFANQKGKLTPSLAQKNIAPMKHSYTPDGKLITEQDGVPIWRLGLTPERWLIPNPADPKSLPTGGNNMYFVADLSKREVYWVQGIPSHWNGKWDHVSLRARDWRR